MSIYKNIRQPRLVKLKFTRKYTVGMITRNQILILPIFEAYGLSIKIELNKINTNSTVDDIIYTLFNPDNLNIMLFIDGIKGSMT
jgi:hypothetical protein